MPFNKKDYPPDWDQIAQEIKAAAGWKCEFCGAPHNAVVSRTRQKWKEVKHVFSGGSINFLGQEPGAWIETARMGWGQLKYHKLTRIILTCAHLDRDKRNNDRKNLAALCQFCHLNHDILQHVANRKYGRYHKEGHQQKLEI